MAKALKIHAVGDRMIGLHRMTACNQFFAGGYYAVTSTERHDDVTCLACLKSLAKTPISLTIREDS